MPLVTVIVAAHNAALHLDAALESLHLQSLDSSDYEILLIDDASTDATLDIAREWAARIGNLRVLRNSDKRGLGYSRNLGMRESAAGLLCFVDADDILQSYALEMLLAKGLRTGADIVYANIDRVDHNGSVIKSIKRHEPTDLVERTLSGEYSFCAVSALYRKDFLLRYSIAFPLHAYYEDISFTVECVLKARTIATVNAVLYYWIKRQGSITSCMEEKKVLDAVAMLECAHAHLIAVGAEKKLFRAWRKLCVNFLQLTHRRILSQAADTFELVSVLRRSVRGSPVFAECGATPMLLRLLPPLRKTWRSYAQPDLDTLAQAAAGAVVMIAETDYHLRNYVAIARRLQSMGTRCMLCDVSISSCFSIPRSVSEAELDKYADVPIFRVNGKKIPLLFTNALAYVFSIDWGNFLPLLVAVKRCGIPAIAFYEGISDDFLNHPNCESKLLPYRNTPYLLAPGEYYRDIFRKQRLYVTGLPVVHSLLAESVVFPQRPTAIVNVNFSYRVLEDCRYTFVDSVVRACASAGVEFLISRHPADTGEFPDLPMTSDSIYDALRGGSMLISRFSTCVIEALALGKPVIYHNPHGEAFPKFQNPMGAFRLTHSVDQLTQAIRETVADIQAGVNFRERAKDFLHHHANAFSLVSPAKLAADALKDIVDSHHETFKERVLRVAGRPARPSASLEQRPFMSLLKALIRVSNNNLRAAMRDPRLILKALQSLGK
jgi:glycosyltransferase involved in cell wall biosynthesis